MKKKLASIDIGSHTARLLVGQNIGPPGSIHPLARRRAYIRLTEGFGHSGNKVIQKKAIDRTLNVLRGFLYATSRSSMLVQPTQLLPVCLEKQLTGMNF